MVLPEEEWIVCLPATRGQHISSSHDKWKGTCFWAKHANLSAVRLLCLVSRSFQTTGPHYFERVVLVYEMKKSMWCHEGKIEDEQRVCENRKWSINQERSNEHEIRSCSCIIIALRPSQRTLGSVSPFQSSITWPCQATVLNQHYQSSTSKRHVQRGIVS